MFAEQLFNNFFLTQFVGNHLPTPNMTTSHRHITSFVGIILEGEIHDDAAVVDDAEWFDGE